MRKNKAADIAWACAKAAYDAYCTVLEDELNTLYDEVQEDFSTFYRAINEEDESKFTAKLTPSEGKLDFDVNFYERDFSRLPLITAKAIRTAWASAFILR